MSGSTESAAAEQSMAARISTLVVQQMHLFTGRGPKQARTTISDDLVIVVLRETLSRGERRLVADSNASLVLDMRQAYQQTMRDELVSGVQTLTGRKVIAFLSANHLEPDIAIETFVLEPTAAGDGDRAEIS